METEMKESTVTGRVTHRGRQLIEAAAGSRGVTLSRFVSAAAEAEARRELLGIEDREFTNQKDSPGGQTDVRESLGLPDDPAKERKP